MQRLSALACLGLLIGACSDQVVQPPLAVLTQEEAADARSAASKIVGKNGRALFVCGQSDGLGVFTLDWDAGFAPDGMKEGRLVFLLREDGREDVYFRDATGAYLSALDDGGEVRRISNPSKDIESWVVSYPSTGIVETHNLTTAPSNQLVDLWTSNKPDSLIGASAKLFRSSCKRA